MNNKFFLRSGQVGCLLGGTMLLLTAGCAAYVDGPQAEVQVAPSVFVAQDDYVYYPTYGVYYSSSRGQYAYLNGGAWVSRPAPYGVSVNVLLASPSVRMDFHDSPALHHAAISRQYPRNWAGPRAANRGQRSVRADDKH